jgi:hypothetical protein
MELRSNGNISKAMMQLWRSDLNGHIEALFTRIRLNMLSDTQYLKYGMLFTDASPKICFGDDFPHMIRLMALANLPCSNDRYEVLREFITKLTEIHG